MNYIIKISESVAISDKVEISLNEIQPRIIEGVVTAYDIFLKIIGV